MDPQRGIYQEAYSWSLELCMDFAEIEIFGQMESRFQNKVLFLRWHAQVHLHLAEYFILAKPFCNFVGHEQTFKFMYFGEPSMSYFMRN